MRKKTGDDVTRTKYGQGIALTLRDELLIKFDKSRGRVLLIKMEEHRDLLKRGHELQEE